MNGFPLGLVVHAVNLPVERERLSISLCELPGFEFIPVGGAPAPAPRPRVPILVSLITETDYADGDMSKFNPARAKNLGLRRLLPHCDGVVCIDADYIIPPGLFNLLMEPAVQPFHVWIRRRDCSEAVARSRTWRQWLDLPVFESCWGSCNYLSRENWRRVGGWDERTYGWGGDDDVLHARIRQAGIETRTIDRIPLMHVAHGRREWGGVNARGAENVAWAQKPQPNYLLDSAVAGARGGAG